MPGFISLKQRTKHSSLFREGALRQLVTTILLCFLSTVTLWAIPSFTQLSPNIGASLGEELELQFYGNYLKDTHTILTYAPGLEFKEFVKKEPKKVVAKFKVKKDAKPGIVPIRLVTDHGMSDLRLFKIYPQKSIQEKEPNTKSEEAQLVENHTTIRGIMKREDVDRYNIQLKAKQTLTLQVEGYKYNARLFDSHIQVLDPSGREVISNDDNTLSRQDPSVTYQVPADGLYQIVFREASYEGRDDEYLLHISSFQRPKTIFPIAAAPNSEVELTYLGTTQKEAPKTKHKFPAQVGSYEFFAKGASIPNKLEIVDAKHFFEKEPNNNSKEFQDLNVEPPFVIHGSIAQEKDVDDIAFNVKKGQKYEVITYARAYGSSLDAHVYAYNAKYKHLANNDDKNGADSRLSFKADADGKHHLKIKDYLGTHSDHHIYAVEVRPETPKISATIFPNKVRTQQLQTVSVPQGGKMAALVSVTRTNFKGDLVFDIKNLPAGVSTKALPVHEKVSKVPVVFTSASNTDKIDTKLASLEVRAKDPKQKIKGSLDQKIDLTYGNPNNAIYHTVHMDKLAVSVMKPVPFKVSLVPFKAPLVRYGSKSFEIKVERDKDFKEEIKLKLLMDIPGVGAALEVKVPKDKTTGRYNLNANGSAALGKWPCAVIAWAKVDGHDAYTSTDLFELEVSEPYLMANIDMAAVSQGQEVDVSCILDQKKPFEGDAKVRLYGLPGKATADAIVINKDMKEAFFKVKTDKATPKGQHKSLFLNVTVMQGGEPIVHNIGGGGTLRVDPPPKKAAPKPAQAKPAAPKPKRKSRLEILREQLLTQK